MHDRIDAQLTVVLPVVMQDDVTWPTIESTVGQTPLVRLQRLGRQMSNNTLLVKLEGNNPAGSVKDR